MRFPGASVPSTASQSWTTLAPRTASTTCGAAATTGRTAAATCLTAAAMALSWPQRLPLLSARMASASYTALGMLDVFGDFQGVAGTHCSTLGFTVSLSLSTCMGTFR